MFGIPYERFVTLTPAEYTAAVQMKDRMDWEKVCYTVACIARLMGQKRVTMKRLMDGLGKPYMKTGPGMDEKREKVEREILFGDKDGH